MTSALVLASCAALASVFGPRYLRRARWARMSPRLGIAAWQATSIAVISAAVLAHVALAVNLAHLGADLATFTDDCLASWQHGYTAPGGSALSIIGLLVVAAVGVRLTWCAARLLVVVARERRHTVGVLDVVARRGVIDGALVLDHKEPFAFCVPGRQPRMIVTSALIASLSEAQLAAVLAHERAHLRSRHHLVLLLSQVLRDALGRVLPIVRIAHDEIAKLVEISADDDARRQVGSALLRQALKGMVWGSHGGVALAATGGDVYERIRRLDAPHQRMANTRFAAVAGAIGLLALVPVSLVVVPVLVAAWQVVCLVA